MRLIVAAAAFLLVVAMRAPLRSDEPIGSSVTFNREVIRIFERKCLPCHTGGAIAMPLGNYRDARLWARAIREEIVEQRMPPWRAAPGYGAFSNDIGLTPRERTTILTWADNGAPRGDDRDLPQRTSGTHPSHSQADQTLQLPAQQIPVGKSVVRRVTLDARVVANRALRQIQFIPGDPRVLRAAFVIAASGTPSQREHWIGVWTPWLRILAPPDGAAFRLDPGARLVVELHYLGVDRVVEDRSQIALFVANDRARTAEQFVLETNQPSSRNARPTEIVIQRPTRLWALLPDPGTSSADADGGSLEVSAHKPDGGVDVLLWMPKRQHEWPTPYILSEPVTLAAGTVVKVRSTSPTRVTFSTYDSHFLP